MSDKELRRSEVLSRVRRGEWKLNEAAARLEISYRQAKRLWSRYRKGAAKARTALSWSFAGVCWSWCGNTMRSVEASVTVRAAARTALSRWSFAGVCWSWCGNTMGANRSSAAGRR